MWHGGRWHEHWEVGTWSWAALSSAALIFVASWASGRSTSAGAGKAPCTTGAYPTHSEVTAQRIVETMSTDVFWHLVARYCARRVGSAATTASTAAICSQISRRPNFITW